MTEDLLKPLAAARSRIEAERVKIELWFTGAIKGIKTEKDKDEILLGYVFQRFVSLAKETFNASVEMNLAGGKGPKNPRRRAFYDH